MAQRAASRVIFNESRSSDIEAIWARRDSLLAQ